MYHKKIKYFLIFYKIFYKILKKNIIKKYEYHKIVKNGRSYSNQQQSE